MSDKTKQKTKKKKMYMTDSRRMEIVKTAIKCHKSPKDKFMDLLPQSYEKISKSISLPLAQKQKLRHLFSTYNNDNKINYVVLLLEGSRNVDYWAIWELEIEERDGENYATPFWRGYIADIPWLWRDARR